jgi:hypothetical protein
MTNPPAFIGDPAFIEDPAFIITAIEFWMKYQPSGN